MHWYLHMLRCRLYVCSQYLLSDLIVLSYAVAVGVMFALAIFINCVAKSQSFFHPLADSERTSDSYTNGD